MPVVTSQPLQQSYFTEDIATALLTYNRLRWWRSRDGQEGLYEAATAAAPAAAQITGSLVSPHQLSGKTLSFKVNGATTVAVPFVGGDPITTAQAVTAINAATALVVASDYNGYLRLTTATTGSAASIEILSGDAAVYLGFTVGDAVVGQDQDSTLISGTHEYFYNDQNSSQDFWYRVEFRSTTGPQTTGLGVAFPGSRTQAVPKAETIVAYIRMVDFTGNPLACREVTLHNQWVPNSVTSQNKHWGVFRGAVKLTTDANGYAETRLLRGMQLDLAVTGTGFVRRLQIPSTGDAVDLLDPALVAADEFGIQQQNVPFAVRTS